MLPSNYLSIWEVAHRWHGVDPNKTSPSDLPINVQDTLRYLCHAVLNGELTLYFPDVIKPADGYQAQIRPEIRYYEMAEIPDAIDKCTFFRKYDQSILDQHLI